MNDANLSACVQQPGSKRLRKASRERYAGFRASGHDPRDAAALAGFSRTSGICTKLENNSEVRERIEYLARSDDGIHHEDRSRVAAVELAELRQRINALERRLATHEAALIAKVGALGRRTEEVDRMSTGGVDAAAPR
jgi:hypothetical protein